MSDLMSGRSPWLWLGSVLAMIVAILFGLFEDDEGFDDFEAFARSGGTSSSLDGEVQNRLDDILSGALSGDGERSRGDNEGGYTPPVIADPANQILVADRFGGLAATFDVQDMLDGNGFGVTTVGLTAEGGRERTGVLLGGLMEKAGIEDWQELRILGAFGNVIAVDREFFDSQPDQFLLYWSSDGDPSATVAISDPSGAGRVIDVTNITVIQ